MRILICDDDLLIQQKLTKYLREYFRNNGLKAPNLIVFSSGEELLQDKGEKDIVFLDIEMPGVSGIFTGRELKQQNPNTIIFVITSYMEYLDEAMRFHVFRYLSKPIDKLRLFRNFHDALQAYNTFVTKIPVETKQGIHSVLTSEIISVEAIGRKVIVHTKTTDYESIHTMQYWLELLNHECFFQSHRSFIVNMQHVTDFDHFVIHLCEQQFTAYLTRRKYTAFKEAYLLYLESTSSL